MMHSNARYDPFQAGSGAKGRGTEPTAGENTGPRRVARPLHMSRGAFKELPVETKPALWVKLAARSRWRSSALHEVDG